MYKLASKIAGLFFFKGRWRMINTTLERSPHELINFFCYKYFS